MKEHINEEKQSFHFTAGIQTVTGTVVTCRCGQKMLVESIGVMPRDIPRLTGLCLECVDLSPEFRRQCPEVAAAIDRWKSEPQPERP